MNCGARNECISVDEVQFCGLVTSAHGGRNRGIAGRDRADRAVLERARLMHGHFDLWPADGIVNFRHSLILAGGAEANDAQCDMLIRSGVDACQRYFPAMQFVIWAGQPADTALENALLETQGEA